MTISHPKYIFYEGKKFTVEWYYNSSGKSKPLEYAETLTDNHKAKLLSMVITLADIGEIKNITKFRNEGDGIYAFKPKPYRFLCFFEKGKKIVITNGFYKDQQKLPANEKKASIKV